MIKCDFCGTVFDEEEAIKGCKGCPLSGKCAKKKCPNCGYEMLPEPEIKGLKFFGKIFGKKNNTFSKIDLSSKKSFKLTEMAVNQEAVIDRLETIENDKVKKLSAFGVLPGNTLTLLQTYPAYVIQVGFTQVALDKDIASSIILKK